MLAVASAIWSARPEPASEAGSVRFSEIPQAAPLCPWREPEQQLHLFFPGADRWLPETRVLSLYRAELGRRLGRSPAPDELALLLYHVHQGAAMRGVVMTRRARGEYGAIEVVVALTPEGTVRAVRLQRLREPAAIARALRSPAWLQRFAGRNAASDWKTTALVSPLPTAARPSGGAVVQAVRSLAILYEVSNRSDVRRAEPHH